MTVARLTACLYLAFATTLSCLVVTDVAVSSASATAVILALLTVSIVTGMVVAEQWVVALPLVVFGLAEVILIAVAIVGEAPSDGQAGAVVLLLAGIGMVGVVAGRWIIRAVTRKG